MPKPSIFDCPVCGDHDDAAPHCYAHGCTWLSCRACDVTYDPDHPGQVLPQANVKRRPFGGA